ncbi:MAG: DDE-type integrase/transposase/recombinase [Deltaproteobacteria bacterium]|nr:DDE-type integrase/transposase/recombinase [Deltaproteobacteria bacterium]
MAIILNLLDLAPPERARAIAELTAREFNIPYSRKKRVSRATIYQWLKEYRRAADPAEALLPKPRSDRGVFRRLTEPQKKALMRWRSTNPYRTAEQLREELMVHAVTSEGPIPSPATIARFLRSVGLDRKTLLAARRLAKKSPVKIRLAFEAPYPQRIWMADTKGPQLWVQDPRNPGELVIAKLILFVDDYSRFFCAYRYALEETEEQVMLLFRQAVAGYGAPDILYVDRGAPYAGHSLKRAAALIGCRVLHPQAGDPSPRGKVERPMRELEEKLESELRLKKPPTLEEANEYLAAFVTQDYHHRVHSSTNQTPEERFFAFPPEYRRFVSEKALALIFLPYVTSRVTKTGLIRLNKKQYLVPDARLYGKKVEVRYDPLDQSKVYVWFDDQFFGEAHLYAGNNDYLKRQELLEKMLPEITVPLAEEVPPYTYLERRLAAYRLEKELSLNDELAAVKAKKEAVKAALTGQEAPAGQETGKEFGPDRFIHLLSVLLRRKFAPHERLLIHTCWQHYGPFNEELVRTTVGRLLGEGLSDLSAYLDALRLAAHFQN